METNLYIGKETVKLTFPVAKVQDKIDGLLTYANIMSYKMRINFLKSHSVKINDHRFHSPASVYMSIWDKEKSLRVEFFLSDEKNKKTYDIKVTMDDNRPNIDVINCTNEKEFIAALDEATIFI